MRLKIVGDNRLDQVSKRYLIALNWLSGIVFKKKILNSVDLCNLKYAGLRRRKLTSQLACSACKVVCATYKSMKSNKQWNLATFKKPCIPIVWKRDFNVSRNGLTLWGKPVSLRGQTLPPTTTWKDSRLIRVNHVWFMILSHEIEIVEPATTGCIVGVDLGLKRLITATNSNNSKTFFFHGGPINHRRTCIRRTRGLVQSVGTRSSHRLLTRMSLKEGNITKHLLHIASKKLVGYAEQHGANRIVMEDLGNIKESSLKKGKDLRSAIHRWPYAMLKFFVTYKAAAKGIVVESISPHNTSRACPRCGYVDASNRKGLRFKCKKCNHQADADRNASENIRLRSVVIEHNLIATGNHKLPQNSEPSEISAGAHVLNGPSGSSLGSWLKPPPLDGA
jgi:putative transposase